jgi:hypothetical protein
MRNTAPNPQATTERTLEKVRREGTSCIHMLPFIRLSGKRPVKSRKARLIERKKTMAMPTLKLFRSL